LNIGLDCIYLGLTKMLMGMMLLTSMAYYRCGNIIEAKMYIPSQYINVNNRRVRLLYRGLEFNVSASPPRNSGRGLKVYIPVTILHLANLLESRPNKALVEISREDGYSLVEIVSFGWRCRICGELTLEDDELCWSHRVHGEGVCRRCGKPILKGELCENCMSRIYRAYIWAPT